MSAKSKDMAAIEKLYLWGLPIVGAARWRQAYQETFDLQSNLGSISI
jgi:hypothetical protein